MCVKTCVWYRFPYMTILQLYKSNEMYLWYSVWYLQVYSHMFCKVSLPYMGTESEVGNRVL